MGIPRGRKHVGDACLRSGILGASFGRCGKKIDIAEILQVLSGPILRSDFYNRRMVPVSVPPGFVSFGRPSERAGRAAACASVLPS